MSPNLICGGSVKPEEISFAVAIAKGAPTSFNHAAVIFATVENQVRGSSLLEHIGHRETISCPFENGKSYFKLCEPSVHEDYLADLAAEFRQIWISLRKSPNGIPYGLRYQKLADSKSLPAQGENFSGYTCTTFILAILEQLNLYIFDHASFCNQPDSTEQTSLLKLSNILQHGGRGHEADPAQAQRLREDMDSDQAMLIKPSELMAGILSFKDAEARQSDAQKGIISRGDIDELSETILNGLTDLPEWSSSLAKRQYSQLDK